MRLKIVATVSMAALLSFSGTIAFADEVPTPADTGFSQLVTAPNSTQNSMVSARGFCSFTQHGDNVHISKTPPATASAHGWWINGNCKATKAVVTVGIQKKNALGIWYDVTAPGKKTVMSGGGSVARANVRYECVATNQLNTFRTWVDVDVVGVADAPNRAYGANMSLWCD